MKKIILLFLSIIFTCIDYKNIVNANFEEYQKSIHMIYKDFDQERDLILTTNDNQLIFFRGVGSIKIPPTLKIAKITTGLHAGSILLREETNTETTAAICFDSKKEYLINSKVNVIFVTFVISENAEKTSGITYAKSENTMHVLKRNYAKVNLIRSRTSHTIIKPSVLKNSYLVPVEEQE